MQSLTSLSQQLATLADPLDNAIKQTQAKEQETDEKRTTLILKYTIRLVQQMEALKGEKNQLAMENDLVKRQIEDLQKRQEDEWKEYVERVNKQVSPLLEHMKELHNGMMNTLNQRVNKEFDLRKALEDVDKKKFNLSLSDYLLAHQQVGIEQGKLWFMGECGWASKWLSYPSLEDFKDVCTLCKPEDIKSLVSLKKPSSATQLVEVNNGPLLLLSNVERDPLLFPVLKEINDEYPDYLLWQEEAGTLRKENARLEQQKQDMKQMHAEEMKVYQKQVNERLQVISSRILSLRDQLVRIEKKAIKIIEHPTIEHSATMIEIFKGEHLSLSEMAKIADQGLVSIESCMQQFLKTWKGKI